ncbi:hypothetical protein CLCR_03778 [Cladophialophora carrionii]|uniref:Uncharacterized protein n=1 Tax=Cladophialophora carrionii TaxID=86049 RepID=A0A1C1CG18_9EURO|nr:hypothetical protein CLCR_03778 [Cladophialophora carrionii]
MQAIELNTLSASPNHWDSDRHFTSRGITIATTRPDQADDRDRWSRRMVERDGRERWPRDVAEGWSKPMTKPSSSRVS